MTSPLPEATSGPPLAILTDTETLLLAHIASLESELSLYRPKKPPPGWLPVKVVADKLRLTDMAVYRAASEGRITSTKIGRRVWIAPIEGRPARKKYKRRA
jgi:hypothetical protein